MENAQVISETKEALIGIVSAIMQMSEAKEQKLRIAKNVAIGTVTKTATVSTIYGLVSTFGVAGTGTAIGGLSGAAASSATLAWIGGLVGGGMAAGAIILPVAGFLAGFAVLQSLRQKKEERPRKPTDLKPFETEILFCAFSLLRPLQEVDQDKSNECDDHELRVFIRDGIEPLLDLIHKHGSTQNETSDESVGTFFATLSKKFFGDLSRAYKRLLEVCEEYPRMNEAPKSTQMAGKSAWISRLFGSAKRSNSSRSVLASAALAATFHHLLHEQEKPTPRDLRVVVDALRRTNKSLAWKSEKALADFLHKLSNEELTTIVAATKRELYQRIQRDLVRATEPQLTEENGLDDGAPDLEFTVSGRVPKFLREHIVLSSLDIHDRLVRFRGEPLPMSQQMVYVLEAINSPQLRAAILNHSFIERLKEHEQDGLLYEVSDELLESAIMQAGVLVYHCINSPAERKIDYEELIQNAAIGFGMKIATDAAGELIWN